MSDNLRYKDSITPTTTGEWKLYNGTFNDSKIVLEPGGYMQFVKAPKDEVDQSISEKYKVVITYENPLPMLYSKVDYMFEMHLVPKGKDEGLHTAISTSAHPNTKVGTTMNRCVTYVDAKGGFASQIKMILRNLSNESITINSVEVYPSYTIDDITLSEMEQYMPSILHYSNFEPITCSMITRIVNMDISTTMDTNLNLHLLLNGTSSFTDEMTLEFKVDGEHLQYSPLTFDVPSGKFLIGIPANIMQVEAGNNKFEVNLISNSDITFDIGKVQCTVDGKGMINRSVTAAPSAFETVTVPNEPIPQISVGTNFVEDDVHVPISVYVNSEQVEIKNLRNYGDIVEICNNELLRVAEDIWFGPTFENGFDNCEHEVFRYNTNVVHLVDGTMQLKNANSKSVKFDDVAEYDFGNIYSMDLDNRDIRAFERLSISPITQSITSTLVPLNSDTLEEKHGYDNSKGLKILVDNKFTNDVVTVVNDELTYTEVIVDESLYNNVNGLE